MPSGGDNVGVGGQVALSPVIHRIEDPIFTLRRPEHFGVEVFVPVVALQGSPDLSVQEGPNTDAYHSRHSERPRDRSKPTRTFLVTPEAAHDSPHRRSFE